MVTRDDFTSYTTACITSDETATSMRSGLLECTAPLRSGSGCKIRVGAHIALQSLVNDQTLQRHQISIEVGRVKNPIAEKAIQEL